MEEFGIEWSIHNNIAKVEEEASDFVWVGWNHLIWEICSLSQSNTSTSSYEIWEDWRFVSQWFTKRIKSWREKDCRGL